MTISKKITEYFKIIKSSINGDEHDFTNGSIKKAIFLLAIPMILELALESVFAVVDIFFVSKLGKNAIATVGYTETLITLVYSVAIGLSTAITALVARRIGEKNQESASRYAMQAILISGIVAIALSVLGVVFARNMLRFMGASIQVIEEGIVFTTIMFGSSAVILFLFMINGIFRGAGNAAIAMKSLWLASLTNIILDPLLIYGFLNFEGYGLKGAAIATCIGRSLGVMFQCYHLFNGSGIIKIKAKMFVPNWEYIKSILSLAWPATFQFIIASGSWIILAKIIAESGGTTASAAYQIAIRCLVFFILPAWGLSNAATTLVGQNLGAKQIERAEKSVLLTVKYNIYFMIIVTIIFVFGSSHLMQVFSSSPDIIDIGTKALKIIGSGFIFYGIGMVLIQALNGAGDTKSPTLIHFFGFWLFQIPLAFFLSKNESIGFYGAIIAVPVAETCMAFFAWFVFKKGKWKLVKV